MFQNSQILRFVLSQTSLTLTGLTEKYATIYETTMSNLCSRKYKIYDESNEQNRDVDLVFINLITFKVV
jgi:hypothetical protein